MDERPLPPDTHPPLDRPLYFLSMRVTCDILVLGSGIAGLTFALEASRRREVTILTKRQLQDSATAWAQGGIAAVLDPEDSFESHVDDTLEAGGGLCHREVVELVVRDAPARIDELVELGAHFSRNGEGEAGELDLTREGGHSARRVVHAGDLTGREVYRTLAEAARRRERIRIREGHMAIELIEGSRFGGERQVLGAYVLDEETGEVHTYLARTTVLATGGAGKVYLYTSNPDVATGDGMAMAYRAGATLANMEFFQFHPTCLYHPEARTFLISEVLRGEGGVLRLADGTPFMANHDPRGDLAPRDVVARAIDFEMKRTGDECVYLDMSARDPAYLTTRFAGIHAFCLQHGVDMTREWIPVVPAAHYACGGVVTDTSGRTSLPGLLAVGEVAATGLHGANRLASNSLLEGLVFGHRAALALREDGFSATSEAPAGAGSGDPSSLYARVPDWDPGEAVAPDEAVVVAHNWDELRRFMWNYVGVVRSEKRLRRAARRIALLREEIREYYWRYLVTRDLIELRNIADVAHLIIEAATFRKESRGLHFTLDHPDRDDARFGGDTRLRKGEAPHLASLPERAGSR